MTGATSDIQLPSHKRVERFARDNTKRRYDFLTMTKHTMPRLGIEPLSDRNFPASLITIVQDSMIAIEVAMLYIVHVSAKPNH